MIKDFLKKDVQFSSELFFLFLLKKSGKIGKAKLSCDCKHKWIIVLLVSLWVLHNKLPDCVALLHLCGIYLEYQRQLESRFLQVKLLPWPCGNEKQSTRTISTYRLWYFFSSPLRLLEKRLQPETRQDTVHLPVASTLFMLRNLNTDAVICYLVFGIMDTSILHRTNL